MLFLKLSDSGSQFSPLLRKWRRGGGSGSGIEKQGKPKLQRKGKDCEKEDCEKEDSEREERLKLFSKNPEYAGYNSKEVSGVYEFQMLSLICVPILLF
ncbi:MAG: hypothetical protein RID53_04085 [Coleofasciculus sp. B1-GNL1-01]|uniref:hypothetical protein n=1 Tax=Coleofasciculus sp. B1-GNL1-01 TaxID=3068484 RepID=UPI0032FBE215